MYLSCETRVSCSPSSANYTVCQRDQIRVRGIYSSYQYLGMKTIERFASWNRDENITHWFILIPNWWDQLWSPWTLNYQLITNLNYYDRMIKIYDFGLFIYLIIYQNTNHDKIIIYFDNVISNQECCILLSFYSIIFFFLRILKHR